MSRYYAVRISDPKTNEILVANLYGKPGFSRVPNGPNVWTYCSLYAGGKPSTYASSNANAQQITFDIHAGFLDTPIQNGLLQIDGVTLQEISQGANLTGLNIAVYGGMAKGLPLANPNQIGRLCAGQILNMWGNWIGVDQYLAIVIQAGGSNSNANQTTGNIATINTPAIPNTNRKPGYLVFTWEKGQSLVDALTHCLQTYYPQYGISGSISPNLVWTDGIVCMRPFAKLSQLAQFVREASLNMIGGYAPDLTQYMGVRMSLQGNMIYLQDGTTPTKPKTIYVTDLVGQPTYNEPFQIQLTCVLRGDIKAGDYVTIPQGQLNIGQGAQVGYVSPPPLSAANTAKSNIAFTGSYLVLDVQHYGTSRNPDWNAWVTTLDLLVTEPYDAKSAATTLAAIAGPNKQAYNFYLPT
ncbi:hypothetical protein [Paraburkholderia terrae]|uniref:hypothetical protein n=1 Tax=Paraburkholderia terrae TaxID=311230 RepID=UPI001EE2A80A|nr:hypothetical protein [Paraburkholderia terrae]GJH02275.1 hypothetical protein CBA19C8_16980 [Paraburkholderia terrae]